MMLQWWMLILSMAKIPNNGNLRSEQFSFKLLMLTLMLFSIVMWHILKVLKWISWLAVLMLHYLCHPQATIRRTILFITQTFPKSFIWLSNESAINFRLCCAHLENKSATPFSGEGPATIFQPSEDGKKSSPSLKDTEADNRFTDWFTWRRIKKIYNLTHKRRHRISLSLPDFF